MKLAAITEDLWHADGAVRLLAVEFLYKAVLEMEDIRSAQPALTLLLADPDLRVKKAALVTIEYRGRLGADIGLAVPMLETLLADKDDEIRKTAWEAIQHADRRLFGIAEIVESRKPEFIFSRTTRTTLLPKAGPEGALESTCLAKKRIKEPYATKEARQFFETLFSGRDLETLVSEALSREEDLNTVRAAAYLLEVLGFPEIWPHNPDNLQKLIERAVFLLKTIADSNSANGNEKTEHRSSYGDVMASIEKQLTNLASRIASE